MNGQTVIISGGLLLGIAVLLDYRHMRRAHRYTPSDPETGTEL